MQCDYKKVQIRKIENLPVHQFLVYQKDCKDTLLQIDFDHSLTQQIVYRITRASLHHMLPMPLLNLKFRLEMNLDPVVQNEINYTVNNSYCKNLTFLKPN